MKKSTLWAGVVSGGIQLFNNDPNGTVEGLQGSRKFTIEGTDDFKIVDDNGNNALNSPEAGHGQDNAGSVQQGQDNTGPVGGAAQTQQTQSAPPQTA